MVFRVGAGIYLQRRDYLLMVFLLLLLLVYWFIPRQGQLSGRFIYTVVESQKDLWIGTNAGALRVNEAGELMTLLQKYQVYTIKPLQDTIWLGTSQGAFRMSHHEPIPILEDHRVTIVTELQGAIWLGTSQGAFRVQDGKLETVLSAPQHVFAIEEVDRTVWIATSQGAFRIDKGKAVPVHTRFAVHAISEVQGRVAFATELGAFRFNPDKGIYDHVYNAAPVNIYTELQGQVWLATDAGVFQMRQKTRTPILEHVKATVIADIQGRIWLGTSQGAFEVLPNRLVPILSGVPVNAIAEIRGELWLATAQGAFRVVDGHTTMALDRADLRSLLVGLRYVLYLLSLGLLASVGWSWRQRKREERRTATRIALDIERARQQMESLLPPLESFTRRGIQVAHRRRYAINIAGDFYNWIPRGDGSLGIYFVDGLGHGFTAAFEAQFLYQAILGGDWGLGDARDELERADEIVSENTFFRKGEIAFCFSFTEIDPQKMEVRYANAGMPFPLLFRLGESVPQPIQAVGLYVGEGYRLYPMKPDRAQVQVGDGDILVMFSDGIFEARDDRERIFGRAGITAAVSRKRHESPEVIADEIMRAVQAHSGKTQPDDDQTLAVILIGEERGERPLHVPAVFEAQGHTFNLTYVHENRGDAMMAVHNELRPRLKKWVQSCGFSNKRALQVWGATWEAIQNAFHHGSQARESIRVRFVPPDASGVLGIEISQPELWENWDETLGTQPSRSEQTLEQLVRGTARIRNLSDGIQVTDLGRKLLLQFAAAVKPQSVIDETLTEC